MVLLLIYVFLHYVFASQAELGPQWLPVIGCIDHGISSPDSLEAAQISALYLPFVAMMAGFLDVEDEIHIDPQSFERV